MGDNILLRREDIKSVLWKRGGRRNTPLEAKLGLWFWSGFRKKSISYQSQTSEKVPITIKYKNTETSFLQAVDSTVKWAITQQTSHFYYMPVTSPFCTMFWDSHLGRVLWDKTCRKQTVLRIKLNLFVLPKRKLLEQTDNQMFYFSFKMWIYFRSQNVAQ